jgi:hypothetical protein
MQVTEFVLKVATSESRAIDERIERLDEKTSVILGFVIVSVAEILGFLLLVSAEARKVGPVFPPWVLRSLFLGFLCILVAMILGLWELLPRKTHIGFSVRLIELMDSKGHSSEDGRMQATLALLEAAIDSKSVVLRAKARLALWTALFVGGAVVAHIVAIVLLLGALR